MPGRGDPLSRPGLFSPAQIFSRTAAATTSWAIAAASSSPADGRRGDIPLQTADTLASNPPRWPGWTSLITGRRRDQGRRHPRGAARRFRRPACLIDEILGSRDPRRHVRSPKRKGRDMKGFGVHTSMVDHELGTGRDAAGQWQGRLLRHGLFLRDRGCFDPPSVERGPQPPHARGGRHALRLARWAIRRAPSGPSRKPRGCGGFSEDRPRQGRRHRRRGPVSGVIYGASGTGRACRPQPRRTRQRRPPPLTEAAGPCKIPSVSCSASEPVEPLRDAPFSQHRRAAVAMIERSGGQTSCSTSTPYHMNIEKKGIAGGIFEAREHLRYIHLSRIRPRHARLGAPSQWDEIFANAQGHRASRRPRHGKLHRHAARTGPSACRSGAPGRGKKRGDGHGERLPFLRGKAANTA